MSGPKTSRYTLTAEQRRILAEQRRIQREIQKNVVLLKQNTSEMKTLITKIDDELSQYKRIVAETGKANLQVERLESTRNQAMQIFNEAGLVSEKCGLNALETVNKKLQEIKKIVVKDEAKISSELKMVDEEFRDEINSAISEGFTISFIKIEEESEVPDISVYTAKIDKALAEIREMQLSDELKLKFDLLKQKAAEIDSIDFIENYYAMSVIPFVKECRVYNSLYLEYGARFDELYLEYKVLANKLSLPKYNYVFSLENIEELERLIHEMQTTLQRKEEQEYISECVDKAMQEMGYKVIGDREIVRKNGRRFTNELYLFDEGTAVNVTYSDDGQITMELGGLDSQDRIPSDAESQSLAEDMLSFCEDYRIIEEKLKKMGVLTHRVSILPPDAQFAQIINTSDYRMSDAVKGYKVKKAHRASSAQSYMRKGE